MKQALFAALVLVALTTTAIASDEDKTLTTTSRQGRRCTATRFVEDVGCGCFLTQRNRFPTTDRQGTLVSCRRAFAPLFPSQLGFLCSRYLNRRGLISVRRATRGILTTLARCDPNNLSARNLIVGERQVDEGTETDISDVDVTEIIDTILGDGELEV